MRLFIPTLFVFLGATVAATAAPGVTFHKNVEPILQRSCQECHRPGEIGPMPLLSYEQARPWAKGIKAAVLQNKMPPWPADPHYAKFANDRSLTKAQIDTLAAWADSGAPEGNKADAPKPRTWVDGWNIPKPDHVVEMPQAFEMPASGTVEYQYIVVPTGMDPNGRDPAVGSHGSSSRRGLHPRAWIEMAGRRSAWRSVRTPGGQRGAALRQHARAG